MRTKTIRLGLMKLLPAFR